jgi:hypothetical protein
MAVAAIISFNGCNGMEPKTSVIKVSIKNASLQACDWVKLDWSGPQLAAGIISAGTFKTVMDFEWPFLTTAKLTFVDDKTRKPYSINLDFEKVNKEIRAGTCKQVTIRILAHDKAEVACE